MPASYGLDPTDAFGVAAPGVVRVGIGRDDDEQARRHREPGQLVAGVTVDGSRRSITRGIRRRSPRRRPASISPSTTPMSAPTSISDAERGRQLAGEVRQRGEVDGEVHEEARDDRSRSQRHVAEQHREAEERQHVGGAGHLLDVTRQGAEHDARADEPADRGTGAPLRGVAPVASRDPRRDGADEDDRGQPVHELLARHRHHDALDVAPGRRPSRGTRCTRPPAAVRRASGTRATPGSPSARSRGCPAPRGRTAARRGAAPATSRPARGTTRARPTRKCPRRRPPRSHRPTGPQARSATTPSRSSATPSRSS